MASRCTCDRVAHGVEWVGGNIYMGGLNEHRELLGSIPIVEKFSFPVVILYLRDDYLT